MNVYKLTTKIRESIIQKNYHELEKCLKEIGPLLKNKPDFEQQYYWYARGVLLKAQGGGLHSVYKIYMQAIHITLPTIMPTIILLWIMQVGNILSAGFDQHLIIGNTVTQRYWDVIDTYAYRYGVQNGYYSLGAAVSMIKSVIGFALVLITNAIARKFSDVALF